MTKRKRKHKPSSSLLRVLVVIVLIGVALIPIIQLGAIKTDSTTHVQLLMIPDGGGGGTGPTLTDVANTWQEWSVSFRNGQFAYYKSDVLAVSFELVPNAEPSVLDITFPTVLTANLPSHHDLFTGWKTVVAAIPVMTVLVDYRAAGALSNFQPISFTSDDQVGTKKSWTARIVFSGSPSQTQNMLNLQDSLSGKSSAFIQVVLSQVWTTYQSWDYSAASIYCNGEIVGIKVSTGPELCQTSQKTVPSPYGLNFNWSPAATGTASFTWPTGLVTTAASCPGGGNICQIWTHTGTDTITLWSNSRTTVTATLAGPTSTVTQGIGTLPTDGTSGLGSGACKLAGVVIPDWFCGKWLGVPNWAWVILAVLGFILFIAILAYALRKQSSPHAGGSKA